MLLRFDTIARTGQFHHRAAAMQFRPWQWHFLLAADGRTRLDDLALRCGIDFETAAALMRETEALGLLEIVALTLDEYRAALEDAPGPEAAHFVAPPSTLVAIAPSSEEPPRPSNALVSFEAVSTMFGDHAAAMASMASHDAHEQPVASTLAEDELLPPEPPAENPVAKELFSALHVVNEPYVVNEPHLLHGFAGVHEAREAYRDAGSPAGENRDAFTLATPPRHDSKGIAVHRYAETPLERDDARPSPPPAPHGTSERNGANPPGDALLQHFEVAAEEPHRFVASVRDVAGVKANGDLGGNLLRALGLKR